MKNKQAAFSRGDIPGKRCLGGAILFFASLLFLSGCKSEKETVSSANRKANVEFVKVGQTAETQVRELAGRVEQTGIAPLAPEVSGRLINIAVLDGQTFKKGQLIAQIDPEPYKLNAQRASAQYRQMAEDLVRKRQLRDEKILSQGAFEQVEAATEMARVQEALAKRDLRNTNIVAPFTGRLASRNVALWQTVQAGVPAFNLENTERFDVSVDLPQAVAQRLPLNSALKATAWLPERPDAPFTLTYRERATQNVPGAGVFRLIFTGPRPADIEVLAGMSLRVRLDVESGQPGGSKEPVAPALVIPISALLVAKDKSHYVWRINARTSEVEAVPVQVLDMLHDKVTFTGNLQVGDQVVGAGSQFLRAGQRVNPIGQPQ